MVCGIVSEYNPFHKGHLYHINEVKKMGADAIVVAMSGNFVQRGECAYLDKWERARMAVLNGADVVIDLPTPWSASSAESFARGAIGLLSDFGVDSLSFGSETEEKSLLLKCAKATENPEVNALLMKKLSEGLSYPKAIFESVSAIKGEEVAQCLLSPNSTLGLEYIKAIEKEKRKIDFLPVLRVGASHDSERIEGGFASASYIRDAEDIEAVKAFLPLNIYERTTELKNFGFAPYRMANNERAILSSLREMKKEEYSLYVSDENGLSERLFEAARTAKSLGELYDSVKVKNYTHSRIRREVLMLYLKCPKSFQKKRVPYLKISAVSEKGLTLLKSAKENSSVPMITQHSHSKLLSEEARAVYDFECRSTDKFALFSKNIRECALEETHSLLIVR